MPLKKGKNPKVISSNIRELMDTYKSTGMIGNTKPKDSDHAQRIAIAVASRYAGIKK